MLSTAFAIGRGGFVMHLTGLPLSFLRRMQAARGGSMAREKRESGSRRRRWPWVLLGLGVLFFVLVALAVLARPMADVKPEAEAAKAELERAQDAIEAQDVKTAETHVALARQHVDRASDLVNGFGGDVWRWVPVAGGGVKDVRHLVAALDHATSMAEIGTQVYPELMQSDDLVQGKRIDLDKLDGILADLELAGTHLRAASDDLAEVKGNTPFVGDAVADARDEASARIDPLRSTYDEAEPVLEALPDVLGQDQESKYLVAIMNPAEQRYSGGATLTLVPLMFDKGNIEFGDTVTNEDIVADGRGRIGWPKVVGNPFHRKGKARLVSATFSPYWTQSGEELLRAWKVRFDEDYEGVIAVDLVALARLMNLTGPVQAEGVGELNAGNLVKVLAGSYDKYASEEQRREINRAVVPAFREKLFQGGKFFEKFQVLARAAKGRHFALYFRDTRLQTAFQHRHLSGDLSGTDNDYLGVFSQNTNFSKADYWQARTVDSDVKLKTDGSAEVTVKITVDNDSPPFTPPWAHGAVAPDSEDPGWGYFTRYNGSAVALFMPRGAELQGAVDVDGEAWDPVVRQVLDRPYIYRNVTLEPQASTVITVKYRVPDAAVVDGSSLLYHLDIDQQGMVTKQKYTVTLHVPEGYGPTATPEGWKLVNGRTLRFSSGDSDESKRLEVDLARL
jgi:hypothetical protein